MKAAHQNQAQEVIIQNFRAKQGTAMAAAPEPPLSELLWTVALARLLLGPKVGLLFVVVCCGGPGIRGRSGTVLQHG